MTYKEAFGIQTISYAHRDTPHENIEEAREKLFEACWKADKYRWHDLKKEPTDLPKVNSKEVEVMFLTEYGFYNIGYYGENGHYRDKYFRHSRDGYEGYSTHCVIAWKYIEPFEEADKDS